MPRSNIWNEKKSSTMPLVRQISIKWKKERATNFNFSAHLLFKIISLSLTQSERSTHKKKEFYWTNYLKQENFLKVNKGGQFSISVPATQKYITISDNNNRKKIQEVFIMWKGNGYQINCPIRPQLYILRI